MTNITDIREMKARIVVFGVGGAGGNAVNNMIAAGLQGVDFIVANTDAQALTMSMAKRHPDGHPGDRRPWRRLAARSGARRSGRSNRCDPRSFDRRTHGVRYCRHGRRYRTGAAPIIAKTARELGILTIGVVTKPFHFEGQRRMRFAEAGIAELLKVVDTLLIIPNQNLFRVANEKTTFAHAFALADQVLYSGVACISDLSSRKV
jgi:Cell division GTPase